MRSCTSELAASGGDECVFPSELQGVWLLFHDALRQEISIVHGHIMMSQLGGFTCKARWQDGYYKVLSTYSNGW